MTLTLLIWLRKVVILIAAILLILNVNAYGHEVINLTNKSEATLSPVKECIPENFETFFANFSESIAFQKKFTKPAIRESYVDFLAEPEPRIVKMIKKIEELRFPLIPNKSARINQHLIIDIYYPSAKKATVHLTKPDTGYSVYYFFEESNCWELTEIQDSST